MFNIVGTYEKNVDEKNRMNIPNKIAKELGDSFIIARGLGKNIYSDDPQNKAERCLQIYPLEKWNERLAVWKDKFTSELEATAVNRFLNGNAEIAKVDSQGRVVIDPSLLKYAKISGDAVIIGCGEYAEIWCPDLLPDDTSDDAVENLLDELLNHGF